MVTDLFMVGTKRWRLQMAIGMLFHLLMTSSVWGNDHGLQVDPRSVEHGLVVSVDPIASRIGAQVLRDGGNAVDAAIATGFALSVTYPAAGNLGGGGFMMVRLARDSSVFAVDFRERAPEAAYATMFLDANGNIDQSKVNVGWLVVGVPGSPMGYWTVHQRCGKLDWSRLLEPAVQLAHRGFVVDSVLAASLKQQEKAFQRFPETARVYMKPNGQAYSAGERLQLPDLAATLRRIRDGGMEGFYRGVTARYLAEAMRANGGLVTEKDLISYQAKIRQPVIGSYHGYQIVSICPPSSGGTVLIEMLHALEGYDLHASGHNTPSTIHIMAEVMKRAYFDRAKYLGDPDFVNMPLSRLLSKGYVNQWRNTIGDMATPSSVLGAEILTGNESEETTHFSVIDSEGNMVATTTTLEGGYGAKVIAKGTGFLLNNEMHDFNVKPGFTDRSGKVGTAPNLIEPGKRMLSSQTPTLVLKGQEPFMVLGSPGGRTIINTVLQVILNVIEHQMPIQQAVDAPRVHHQWMPDRLMLESGVPNEILKALSGLGHNVRRRKRQGDCHAIWVDPETGRYFPGVDRRIRGAAVGW